MRISQIASRLRSARKARGLTQQELAQRAEVSTRLVAEVERGERDNVSLATVLRLLHEVGVSVRLSGSPAREPAPSGASDDDEAGRLSRAAVRRATWSGRMIRLCDDHDDDPAVSPGVERLAAVTLISTQAYAFARSRPVGRVAESRPAPSRKR